jgi:hypothetical protein
MESNFCGGLTFDEICEMSAYKLRRNKKVHRGKWLSQNDALNRLNVAGQSAKKQLKNVSKLLISSDFIFFIKDKFLDCNKRFKCMQIIIKFCNDKFFCDKLGKKFIKINNILKSVLH